jgi:sulfur-carrier protein adenylyltransferase/sulfurtransferase
MRLSLIAVAVAGVLLVGASPAAPPDLPVSYVSVDELKKAIDSKQSVAIIDVRTPPEYDALHIAGARSIPLRNIRQRAKEIPRIGLVILY